MERQPATRPGAGPGSNRGGSARTFAARATGYAAPGRHGDALDPGVEADLVDEGLTDQLGVVARPEGLGQAGRRDPEDKPLAVVVDDLRML